MIAVLTPYKGVTASNIVLFKNDGFWTPEDIDISGTRGQIVAIEIGYLSGNSLDIIVGYSSGEVGYYRNDGIWTYYQINAGKSTAIPTSIIAIDTMNTAASQGTPSFEDVAVGYSSGGMTIYTNPGVVGMPFAKTSREGTTTVFTGGLPSYIHTSASSENSYNSTIAHGTYASTTWGGTGYEQLNLVNLSKTISQAGTPSVISVVNSPQSVLFSWGSLPDTQPFASVKITANIGVWNGPSYTGTATYGTHTWTINNGATTLNLDLTSYVATLSDLSNLNITLKSNSATKSIQFSNIVATVSYLSTSGGLDHQWNFNVPAGVADVFEIVANTTDTANHDNYTFWYSINSGPYVSLPNLEVNSSIRQLYTARLPDVSTASTIHIRVSDTSRNGGPSDMLQIEQICINSTSISTNPIGSVTAVRVYDINMDHWPDIVVSDGSNVWVLYNNHHGNLITVDSQMVTTGNPLDGILTIGPGTFNGPSNLPDIAVGTTNGIYMINQTTKGNFHAGVLIKDSNGHDIKPSINNASGSEVCMAVGDVMGNGYYDIVVASGSIITLYVNHNGAYAPLAVDNSGVAINTLYLGKLHG